MWLAASSLQHEGREEAGGGAAAGLQPPKMLKSVAGKLSAEIEAQQLSGAVK